MRAWLLAFVLAGCGFQTRPGAAGTGSDVPVDASEPIDGAPVDTKAAQVCLGSRVNVCVDPPTQAATVPTSLDTDTSTACVTFTSTPSVSACVIAGTSIRIGDATHVTGKKKLILLSTSTISVDDLLDVASHKGGAAGPGADVDDCSKAKASGFVTGGAGGSFGGQGASGGATPDSPASAATPAITAITLRGGCTGADGDHGGDGGHGGGGVILLAATTISINGTLNASGASGRGSAGGGGGGGSGGMIVLDAPTSVTIDGAGACFANGGSGGGGGFGLSSGGDGADSDAPDHAARGGDGASVGGGGGGGAMAGKNPTPGDTSKQTGGLPPHFDGGAGGGGGGAGVIEIFTASPPKPDGKAISPAPTVAPSNPRA